jgi:hypothetical protein
MRSLYMTLLALTLCVVTLVATVVPAVAEPRNNQPVAWVVYSGSNNRLHSNAEWNQTESLDYLFMVSIVATRRADGTTVGHAFDRGFVPEFEDNYEVLDSHFSIRGDGARVADILLFSGPGEQGLRWYSWWQFVDVGEPGRGANTAEVYIWGVVDSSYNFSPDGYPTSWPPTFTPTPIPPIGVPKWYPFVSSSPEPIAANIQVRITDAYLP